MIRVILADDHPVVLQGIKKIFENHSSIQVIGEAQNSHELLDLIQCTTFDLLLMELSVPGRNWFDLIREVKATIPRVPILIISMHIEEEYISRALKAGAAGYLTKDSLFNELLKAIHALMQGQNYITEGIESKTICPLSCPGI
jgi:DNA-binding NarL/FixJ family response regulator